jgi:hypothetical protein
MGISEGFLKTRKSRSGRIEISTTEFVWTSEQHTVSLQ